MTAAFVLLPTDATAVRPPPPRSRLEVLREELEEAEAEVLECEDAVRSAEDDLDDAKEEVRRLEIAIDKADPSEILEPPLRFVRPEHVRRGWTLDISANALAEAERAAAGKAAAGP